MLRGGWGDIQSYPKDKEMVNGYLPFFPWIIMFQFLRHESARFLARKYLKRQRYRRSDIPVAKPSVEDGKPFAAEAAPTEKRQSLPL